MKSIKEECEEIYLKISSLEKRLEELRNLCSHKNASKKLYSYRVGQSDYATICDDCGHLIGTTFLKIHDLNTANSPQ